MEQIVVDEDEWRDQELGRVIALGAAIGVPLMFAVAIVLSLLGDLAFWKAASIAVLPALFTGPYVGGLFAMGAASSRHEHAAAAAAVTHDVPEERLAA